MATKKTKPQKRSGPAKSGKTAKKTKPAPKARPRPAAKPARKPVKKAAKPARKAPAKTKKPAAKPARKAAVKKAPAKKAAPPKKAAVKAPPKKVAPPPAVKAAPPAPKPEPPARPPREKKVRPAAAQPAAPGTPGSAPATATAPAAAPARRGRRPGRPPSAERDQGAPVSPLENEGAVGNLPPIRPYRGTKFGKEKKLKPLRPRKSKPRDRFAKLFAEFETKPAPPDKKRKRRLLEDDEEETSFSVIREQPKLQIMSPEQIRADVLRKYMAGEQATCPVGCGGIAEIVRVGTLDDGSGEVWIECLSCAQRERFVIQKASQAERQAAQKGMEEAGEALCPRHGRSVQMRRRGRDLVCPECGVLFPEV